MRTKTLLLTAAIAVVGLVAGSAQSVYSVNAVGYVNLNLPAGFNLISNPLNGTNNNLNTIIPSAPDFTVLYKFNPVTQQYLDSATFIGGEWDLNYTLAPGEGAFVQLPSAATLTFVGEVPQGSLSNPLFPNYQIASSQVPQQGGLSSLGYPAEDFDVVFKFDAVTQQFSDAYTYIGGAWDPADPVLAVGEAVFIQRSTSGNWTRTFSVN